MTAVVISRQSDDIIKNDDVTSHVYFLAAERRCQERISKNPYFRGLSALFFKQYELSNKILDSILPAWYITKV